MTWRRIRIPTLLAALGVVAIATTRRTNADAETSLALYARALTAKQHGQWTRTRSLLKDAWAANPANLLPIVEMRSLFPETWQSPSFLDSLDRIAIGLGDATLGRCVRTMLADTFHVATALEFERGASPVTRRCGRLLRVFNGPGDSGLTLLDEYPGSHYLTGAYSAALARVDPARGLRWARQESRAENHPMLRVAALAVGGYALHKLGRHAEAADWERNAESLAKSWGTGASLLLLNTHRSHVTILGELSDGDSISVHAHAVANHAEAQLVEAVMHADPPGRAAYLWDYGVSLQATGRLDQSRAVFERLASIADTMDSESLEAYVRARLGRTLVKMGRLDAAERELQLSRALAQRAGATIALRESSHDLLHLHEGRGDFTAAIAAGNDFVRYADKAGTMATRMMGHHDLGWLYRRRGRIADAEKAFRAMIADVDTMGSHSYWAGEYSEYAGQVERAREYYRRALQDAQDRSRALSGLVRTSEALGDIEAAKRYGYIADRDTGSWYPEYSPMLPGLLARHGATDEARRQFRASRALAAGRGKTLGFAQLALESAELELQSGAVATARALADSAARAAALLGAGEVEVRARAISALAALRQDTGPRAALASLDSAVRRADAMRIAQLSAAMRLIEGDALRIAGRKTPAMRSYEVAASWVDSTASRIANDPSRASYRTTHIGVSNRALGMLVRNAGYPGRLSRHLEWSARRKGGGAPARAGRAPPAALRARLARDEAIVDYLVLDSITAAVVITSEGTLIVRLAASPDSLRDWIARFRGPIAPRLGTAIDVAHIGFDEGVSLQLYRALVEPLLPRLRGRSRLIVIPDGPLHMLPFDALVTSAAPSRRYVLDDFTILYATSLALIGPRRPRMNDLSTLAFAGPDPGERNGTRAEVAAVVDALGQKVRSIESGTLSKAELRESAAKAGIVHFATHAEANDVNPDLARLSLASGSEPDAWLNAFEIRSWRLRDAFVVLSACETAGGRIAGGEGALSLNRAFLHAGAAATVTTLWPVGKSASVVMAAFYRELAKGVLPADALRAARLELRAAGYDHPFYWAAFVFTTRSL